MMDSQIQDLLDEIEMLDLEIKQKQRKAQSLKVQLAKLQKRPESPEQQTLDSNQSSSKALKPKTNPSSLKAFELNQIPHVGLEVSSQTSEENTSSDSLEEHQALKPNNGENPVLRSKKKFYEIFAGPNKGIYDDWSIVGPLIMNKPGLHKSYVSKTEAHEALLAFGDADPASSGLHPRPVLLNKKRQNTNPSVSFAMALSSNKPRQQPIINPTVVKAKQRFSRTTKIRFSTKMPRSLSQWNLLFIVETSMWANPLRKNSVF